MSALLAAIALGVNLSRHFGEGVPVTLPVEGVSVVRTDLPRDHVEKSDGSLDWSAYDRGYAAIRDRGAQVLWVVSVNHPGPGFREFLDQAMLRYPDSLWEIGNECNLVMSPAEYVAILRSLRIGSERLPVISAGIGGGSWDERWLTEALSLGMGDMVQAIGIHPYGLQPSELGAAVCRLRAKTRLPILITEWGRSSVQSEEGQAQFFADAVRAAERARVPLFVAYSLVDRPDHPGPEAERHYGLFRIDGSPKIAWYRFTARD